MTQLRQRITLVGIRRSAGAFECALVISAVGGAMPCKASGRQVTCRRIR